MKRIALLLAVATAIAPLAARKQTTSRRGTLKPIDTTEVIEAPDTIELRAADIVPSGYVKPLNARSESMLLTNKLTTDLNSVELRISYTDIQGRELSGRKEWVRVDLPGGATRRIDIPTWDSQNSYYYVGGKTPRTPRVTPYRVKVSVTRATSKARE